MNDPTGEKQVDGGIEVIRVLEKERTLFREEDLKALVDGHLWLVGFDLAEIGFNGCVQNQAVLDDELRIESAVKLCRA